MLSISRLLIVGDACCLEVSLMRLRPLRCCNSCTQLLGNAERKPAKRAARRNHDFDTYAGGADFRSGDGRLDSWCLRQLSQKVRQGWKADMRFQAETGSSPSPPPFAVSGPTTCFTSQMLMGGSRPHCFIKSRSVCSLGARKTQ